MVQDKDAPPIYLYTHWDGSVLAQRVADALGKEQRWDDAPYLTRMIFCSMVRNDPTGSSGYGIQTTCAGDAGVTLEVNVPAQTVSVMSGAAESPYTQKMTFTFKEYARKFG